MSVWCESMRYNGGCGLCKGMHVNVCMLHVHLSDIIQNGSSLRVLIRAPDSWFKYSELNESMVIAYRWQFFRIILARCERAKN